MGRDPETKELGVAVSTAVMAVGSIVPHVEFDVGAIATQAQSNVTYGTKGLQLLKLGLSPQTVLDALLKDDPDREVRQVSILDKHGQLAAYTGPKANDWKGHIVGTDHAVAGNILVGQQVIEAMSKTFQSMPGPIEDRLMSALEAGQEAGGDRRGRVSAAIKVMKAKALIGTRAFIDLRVDDHPDPVGELRRLFDQFKQVVEEAKKKQP